MAGEKLYTRIPPASSGPRIAFRHRAIIAYENKVGDLKAEEIYTGASSGIEYLVYKVFPTDSSTGNMEVGYNDSAVFDNTAPVLGEALVNDASVTVANVSSTVSPTEIYTNESVIVGGDNQTNRLNVDIQGSANVRFAEGPGEISGFGSIKTTGVTLLGQYVFQNSNLPNQFTNTITGSADCAVDYIANSQVVRLTNGTTSGDLTTQTTNLYHPYVAGTSNVFFFAARVGDSGKANVIRNWGAFDLENGFFFRLNNTTLQVVHRWTTGGNPTNNMVVNQSAWNKDTLDGSGGDKNPSGINLDPSKQNNYFIDFQFLGGGRTRWGVIIRGQRIVCHEMYHANGEQAAGPINNPIGSPNLPICWSQFNNGAAGSNSEFYALGAGVYAEEDNVDIREESNLKLYTQSYTYSSGSSSTAYIFGVQPTAVLQSGGENHSLYIPKSIDVTATNASTEEDVYLEVRIFNSCIMRGTSYSKMSYAEAEYDRNGDHLAHNPEILRKVIKGNGFIDFDEYLSGVQYGTQYNRSERTSAKNSQAITGVTNANPAVVTVGTNIWYGNSRHLFLDKQAILVENISPGDVATALNGNTYYLALTGGSTTLLYSSSADIDDDRKPREANLTFASGSSVSVGETLTFTGAGTATVTAFSSNTASLEGRTNAALDTGLAGGTVWSGSSGANGTITSIAQQSSTYPLDYETTLNAVDGSGWGSPAVDGNFEGTPPAQPNWVFMARPLSAKGFDINTRWNLSFKERTQ